ncbi:MAG: hypothetical protein LBD04_03750 [Synergistaceae bacterium]|jgi:hypothetical protein|nr:hypothetical protein [Synergistaceae bacterium]
MKEKQEKSKKRRLFSGEKGIGRRVLFHALLCVALCFPVPAGAAVVEADPDLHHVLGDLYVLSAAMQLYRDDTRATRCPVPSGLEGYLAKPLPSAWAEDYRTAEASGSWWVGRRVPEFSRARKFLRANVEKFDLYERESGDDARPWLGDPFVWVRVVSLVKTKKAQERPFFQVAEGLDSRHLFFNVLGTKEYWWSNLLLTDKARAKALKRFAGTEGPLAIPPAPRQAEEEFSASPVKLPPEYNLGKGEEPPRVEIGDFIFNPMR